MNYFVLRSLNAFFVLLVMLWVNSIATGQNNGPRPNDQLVQKMRTIIIPQIEFAEMPLIEALDFLQAEALKHDPQKKGMDIVLLTREKPPPKVTLKLRNVSLDSALAFVTELVGYVYETRDQVIVVRKPFADETGD